MKNDTKKQTININIKMKLSITLFLVIFVVPTFCYSFLPTSFGDGYFISYNKDGTRKDDIKVSEVSKEFMLRKTNVK